MKQAMPNESSSTYLEKAYPNASPSKIVSMSAQDIFDFVEAFLARFYPHCTCAIHFGSSARGDQKDWSDIDLLILIPSVPWPEKRCIVHQGLLVDHYLYDRKFLNNTLDPTFKHLSPALPLGIALGHRIHISQEEGTEIVKKVDACIRSRQPIPHESVEIRNLRANATCLLTELISSSADEEAFNCGVELYSILSRILARQFSGFYVSAKWRWRVLRQFAPSLAEGLQRTFSEFISSREKGEFVRNCELALEHLGGPLWDGYRGPISVPQHPKKATQ